MREGKSYFRYFTRFMHCEIGRNILASDVSNLTLDTHSLDLDEAFFVFFILLATMTRRPLFNVKCFQQVSVEILSVFTDQQTLIIVNKQTIDFI